MKEKTLEKLWKDYLEILPDDSGEVQIEETKRAFHAGFISLFHGVITPMARSSDGMQSNIATLESIQEEVDEYLREIEFQEISESFSAGKPSMRN